VFLGAHDANYGHHAYLESRILAADPVELVNLLYQACQHSVREAGALSISRRPHYGAGAGHFEGRRDSRRIDGVSRLRSRRRDQPALGAALRLPAAPPAGCQHAAERRPLAEVLGLLARLSEAWEGIRSSTKATPVMESP
jgi:hypothetical protein